MKNFIYTIKVASVFVIIGLSTIVTIHYNINIKTYRISNRVRFLSINMSQYIHDIIEVVINSDDHDSISWRVLLVRNMLKDERIDRSQVIHYDEWVEMVNNYNMNKSWNSSDNINLLRYGTPDFMFIDGRSLYSRNNDMKQGCSNIMILSESVIEIKNNNYDPDRPLFVFVKNKYSQPWSKPDQISVSDFRKQNMDILNKDIIIYISADGKYRCTNKKEFFSQFESSI